MVSPRGDAGKEIKDALERLVEENLMLSIGDEYLALPVDRDAMKGGKAASIAHGRGRS